MISLLLTLSTLASPARATNDGLIVQLALLNGEDARTIDARQAFRRIRVANPERPVISLVEHLGVAKSGSPEWRVKAQALGTQLENALDAHPDTPVDLVVVHAGHADFELLLGELGPGTPRAVLAPLRGRLSPDARVILLGHSPIGEGAGRADRAKKALGDLEAPAATLVASSTALRLRRDWRDLANRLPTSAMAMSWAGIGGYGLSRLPDYATNLIYLGIVPAQFPLGYVIHKFRRKVFGTKTKVADAAADFDKSKIDGGYDDLVFGNETMAGAFSMSDLMAAAGILGVGSAVAFNGPGVIDAKFLMTGAAIGAYFFAVFAFHPVYDAIKTARLQRKGTINGGQAYRFAREAGEADVTEDVDLEGAEAYRCESTLAAASTAA